MEDKDERRKRVKLICDMYELAGKLMIYEECQDAFGEFELNFYESMYLLKNGQNFMIEGLEETSVLAEGLTMEYETLYIAYVHEGNHFCMSAIHAPIKAIEAVLEHMKEYLDFLKEMNRVTEE